MNNKLNLTTVLGWGSADVETLEKHIECAEHWGVSVDKIVDEIASAMLEVTDINSWFYSAMSLTFYAVMDEVEKFLEEHYDEYNECYDDILIAIEELKDDYCPSVNFMCSSHDNILDDIELIQPKEQVIKEIINYLIEEVQG